ncbi:stage II sporulation protein R [Bacillus sp. DNRA2]|uniref:stage II sporulation protein R n=1 Tax=Bacillus sp. DNRA2 TaxID=2723053 RepID=UPI00145F1C09|nr:stage II sporulation protein R [Bacillus sp. DNRA2]NMD70052.1 stage II sporulation protein R [Bacillus sp. DNRA2]
MTNKTKYRKTLITVYLLLLSFATIFSLYMPKNEATAQEETVIPNEAIRLRILANSDSEEDQALKRKVRDAVNAEITEWVQDLTSLEEARTTIKTGLPKIQKIAEQVVAAENETQSVKVDFGKVEFPTKLYGQFLYPAGEYEAILITLGKGEGANWWCVLFPPLCFLDFSNGVAVSEGFDGNEGKTSNKKPATAKAETEKIAQAQADEQVQPDATEAAEPVPQTKAPVPQPQQQKQVAEPKASAKQQAPVQPETAKETPQAEKDKIEVKSNKNNEDKQTAKKPAKKSQKPMYTAQDEQEVEVKFFVVELWTKFF